ncbi:gamma-glutamylcyclotransferase family protein [Leptolyngbya sp. NIES-2104]|uniref:gamma-glutamylcyclotransferase family protein n=1 Tax=Leptolyngbya sp. NIES-2104 TaxID=1552121 RepID=UPI0006ECC19E|nr:gamma-glutamylcyclotransferase family protein [Leptolyngbya sp. NIES-2104]GAP96131.1 hypothetical protein NIES2104_26660 [Leptolyngbya sp. NIES-2104]
MQSINVFVYGTLKPDESNYFLCADRVISSKPAIVQAELYHLPFNYPAIVPGDARTYGYLLTFDDAAILEILDEYEQHEPEVIAPFGSDNDYARQEIEVFNLEGHALGSAWVYVMSLKQIDRLGGIRIPSGVWSKKDFTECQERDLNS